MSKHLLCVTRTETNEIGIGKLLKVKVIVFVFVRFGLAFAPTFTLTFVLTFFVRFIRFGFAFALAKLAFAWFLMICSCWRIAMRESEVLRVMVNEGEAQIKCVIILEYVRHNAKTINVASLVFVNMFCAKT